MRGRIIRLPRRVRAKSRASHEPLVVQTDLTPLVRKSWFARLLDKTAAPFWFARMRRSLRYQYRDGVVLLMHLSSKAAYRLDRRGTENFSCAPSTIIACGHKRDMDLPILIPYLYFFRKPSHRKDLRLLYVATRDDVTERGFLMLYFPFLNFLRPWLSRLSLAGYFRILQTSPVKLPDEQTVNQLLHETLRLEGNLGLEEALDPQWHRRLMGQATEQPGLTLQDAIIKGPLEVLGQYAQPRMFREPLATRIRQRHYNTAIQQLHTLKRILERGGTLIVLPEGRVTPDGRFCKMRAAVTRLIQQSRVETRLLPANVTYDFMDTLRPHVTLLVGPEVSGLKEYSKNELAELIHRKVAGLACVTMSGLASRSLVVLAEGNQAQLELKVWREELWAEVQRLRHLGLPIDRQIETRQDFEERLGRFLNYAHQRGGFFLAPAQDTTAGADSASEPGPVLQLDLAQIRREECTKHTDNPIRYCHNELTELLEVWDALPPPPLDTADEDEVLTRLDLSRSRPGRMRRRTAG